MPRTDAAVIERDTHAIVAAGEAFERTDIEADLTLYGDFETTRSNNLPLMGEQDTFISLSWTVEVTRQTPHADDEYPLSMPEAIGNAAFRAMDSQSSYGSSSDSLDAIKMTHLRTQPEARGRGYGLVLWDCYAAVLALSGVRATGKVGDDRDRNTSAWLQRQGVPPSDITEKDSAAWMGERSVSWDTAGENVTSNAPLRWAEVEV